MEYNLGKIYEESIDKEIRKSLGKYYTPKFIIKYILEKTISNIKIIDNPFIKIIDISCGTGFFLLSAYDLLKEKFLEEIDNLRSKYKEEIYILEKNGEKTEVLGLDYWREENIHYHILKNCIYGADKDSFAVGLTKNMLLSKSESDYIENLNIIDCDSLVRWENNNSIKETQEEKAYREFWSNKFDIVVGNPPYIGHKQLDMEYKKWLLEEYKDVFRDKSDISFCFFKRILEILSPKGIASIITSRYFMESPTGKELRGFLKEKANILEIVDFYGANIFKGVGVATAIYTFSKEKSKDSRIKINKLSNDNYIFSDSDNLNNLINTDLFEEFHINKDSLSSDRWILVSKAKLNIYEKIERKTDYRLKDIAECFQGIITGCDKAFVLTKKDISEYNIEKEIINTWIKNSHIDRFTINESNLYLIYSNFIEDEKDYPNSIEYIKKYKNKLENRRECRNGLRRWYQLQWGRKSELFQQAKIVFPYKARENRFALDLSNSYFSADVYAITIKEEFKDKIPLEYLIGLLNSSIYEFYFKLFGKKIGKGMYDYYPNSIMDLKIVSDNIIDEITYRVEKILKLKEDQKNNEKACIKEVLQLEEDIDRIISSYLGLTKEELELIYSSIKL